MREWAMCWANARQTLVRFRFPMVVAGTVSAALVVATAVVGSAVVDAGDRLNTASSLSVIELSSVSVAGEPEPVTVSAVESIAALPGVERVTGVSSVGSVLEFVSGGGQGAEQSAADGFAGVFWALPRFPWSQPEAILARAGWSDADGLAPGEVMLPDEALGVDLTSLLGARVTLEYTRATGPGVGSPEYRELSVVAFYDQASTQRDGEDGVYLGAADFDAVFAASLGSPGQHPPASATYQSALIKATEIASAAGLAADLSAAGYLVVNQVDDPALPRIVQLLSSLASLLAMLLGAFSVGIGVSIAGTWAKLRTWDVGVLRALGWSPRDIAQTYGIELAVVGVGVAVVGVIAGAVASIVFGVVVAGHTVLGVEFQGVVIPSVPWIGVVVLGLPVALLLGAALGLARLVRIEPDVALKRTD